MKQCSDIIKRQYRIQKHPVMFLPVSLRKKYLKALGALLYKCSNNDVYVKFIFEQWAKSLYEYDVNYWNDDLKAIKSIIKFHFVGLKFYNLQRVFFFDGLSLLNFDNNYCANLYTLLSDKVINWYSRKSYNCISSYFKSQSSECYGISNDLIQFEINNRNISKKTKSVLVVANMSAGKSTLINAIIGHRINKSQTTACTSRINRIYNKSYEDGFVYFESKKHLLNYNHDYLCDNNDFYVGGVHFNSMLNDFDLCLCDTPGVNSIYNTEHKKITFDAIAKQDYDVLLYVADATNIGTEDEMIFLNFIKQKCKKPIIFTINKLDKFKEKEDSVEKTIKNYTKQLEILGFKNKTPIPVSANAALLLKLQPTEIDDEDLFEIEQIKKKFSKDYFCLPYYIGNHKSDDVLDRTGIVTLEKIIKHTLFI